MRRLIVMAMLVLLCWLCAVYSRATTSELDAARTDGARGRITLHVVDSKGDSVKDAKVVSGFYNPRVQNDASEGSTGSNGLCSVEGVTDSQMRYSVTKDGYYATSGQYWFYPGPGKSAKNDCWQPWDPTNTVVLKERRNAVPMYAKRYEMPVPVQDVPVGFDLEVGDWVAPHGRGTRPDLLITYQQKIQDYWTGSLYVTIDFPNEQDGFCRAMKDLGSEFQSIYEAPAVGYQHPISFAWETTKEKDLRVEKLGESEYLIIRVRTMVDDRGTVTNAHYAKVYGPFEFGVGRDYCLRFTYYFNPTPNDRNLEFDPEKNLFNWPHDARERPYLP